MKILGFFDYIYYRAAKLYNKTDGPSSIAPEALITLTQLFILIDIISIFYPGFLTHTNISKLIYVLAAVIVFYFNHKRHKGKFDVYDNRWKNELKKTKIIKGLLIILFIIATIAFSGILLNIRNS